MSNIPKSVALVDLSSISVRAYKSRSSDLKLTPGQVAQYTVANTMDELAVIRDSVEHVILCCDRPPYWRVAEYPEYKGTRPPQDEQLKVIKKSLFERIKQEGYVLAGVDGFEGDDGVATLARAYEAMGVKHIRICGCDRDLAQCVTERVKLFVPKIAGREASELGPAEVKKKWGVPPDRMALYQALVGDKGDNIPGVEKVGETTAAKWLSEHGTLMALGLQLVKEKEKGDKMPVSWKNFALAWEQMPLWLRMTTLRTDVPIDTAALLGSESPSKDGVTTTTGTEVVDPPAPTNEPDWDAIAEAEERKMKEEAVSPRVHMPSKGAVERARIVHEYESARKEEAASPVANAQVPLTPLTKYASEVKKTVGDMGPAAIGVWPALVEQSRYTPPSGLAGMRKPFPDHQVSKLPKGTKAQNDCSPSDKRNCDICGGWHHPKINHLDYVGHAALTDRLLEADLQWSWEPLAFTPEGLPRFDATGGLWIKLTVCGVTRLGYGHAASKSFGDPGSREKEVIGDALRNAGMRFGAALDLWFKGGDLHVEKEDGT